MDSIFSTHLESLKECASTPFVVGDKALITFVLDAQQVQFKSDLDDWGEGLSMNKEGNIWWLLVDIDSQQSFSYKFLVGEDWYCDPHNPYISFGPEAENSCIPGACQGGIVAVRDVYSPQLNNSRTLYVYVPPAARNGTPCPIMYAQDGFNVFSNPRAPFGHWGMDTTLDDLIEKQQIPPIIVVAVGARARGHEYSWSSFEYDVEVIPKLEQYTDFIMDTIHPLILERWCCTKDIGVLGGSLGGSSAFWMAWHHRDFFSRVASFSGSFWMENPSMMEIVENTIEIPNIRIYLDAGDTNSEGIIEWEADNLKFVADLHNTLCSCGYNSSAPIAKSIEDSVFVWDEEAPIPKERVCMVVGKGHRHREEDWAKRMRWALRFLYEDLEKSMSARIQQ
ncbi:MAG: hypothetical protein CL916_00760 [Deltaproteobacteria bacterium]|nr:hypothetical protein [Deltaproteobacteria bacterium]